MPEGQDFTEGLNPGSLEVLRAASSSRRWPRRRPATPCQFERLGYFCADPGTPGPARRSSTAR